MDTSVPYPLIKGRKFAFTKSTKYLQIYFAQIYLAQMGFMKGRGCTDAIFVLRQLSENVIEHDRELNIVFVDQEMEFDRVNRDKLWQTLEMYNVQGQLLDSIRAIYANSMSTVRTS